MTSPLGSLARFAIVAFAALRMVNIGAAPANADPAAVCERRDYDILIDNKPAGHYQLQFTRSTQATDVRSACDIDYHFLIFHYRYKYRGHEQWQAGTLQSLESECNDDGKRCAILAKRTSSQFDVTVNGQSRKEPSDLRTSSYWTAPPSQDFSGKFLEVDTGKLMNVRFQFEGADNLQCGQKEIACKRYKLTGDDPGEVWYDSAQHEIVRQISATDGHKTEVRLREITNSAG
jgi:hypothetical protein